MKGDDWQLEMLCNIAASEFLMPAGDFERGADNCDTSIEQVLKWRNQYAVSTEAILLRYAKLTSQPCSVFTAHRDEAASGRYVVDYAVPSRAWKSAIRSGFVLPAETAVAECTGIGFTCKSEETWAFSDGPCRIECLGVPPYPGSVYPRVMGVLHPRGRNAINAIGITYVTGDATRPRGTGHKIVAQIVNDKALTWGRGFTLAVRKKWPQAQTEYSHWALQNRTEFSLGNVHFTNPEPYITLASMVAQHGYGPSPTLRLRYAALETCLRKLGEYAEKIGANIHMPRIGTGEASGNWEVVSDIVDETLCRRGIEVTVYNLPGADQLASKTSAWLFGRPA
jgi:O-acetyl-ADP-ribose deacetylase (regulator of RNase III)